MKTPPNTLFTWQNALVFAIGQNTASLCGHSSGWRLPNILELESLINLGQAGSASWLMRPENGFTGLYAGQFWSSTTVDSARSTAWVIDLSDDGRDMAEKSLSRSVLPVWGTTPTLATQPWKTGQTECYNSSGQIIPCSGTGQDGEIQAGEAWPSHRFGSPINGTVQDNLTGLVWSLDANTPGPVPCNPGEEQISYYAYQYIQCLNDNNYSGFNDWRLPNRKELQSLIDHSQTGPALPDGYPFSGVGSVMYWTSDTYVSLCSSGWALDMDTGRAIDRNKNTNSLAIWPVRGPLSLKILFAGDGEGNVTGDGISCSATRCLSAYYMGETAVITAVNSSESLFAGWTGCPSPTGNECSIFMDEDITVTASFLAAKSIWDKPSSLNFGKVGVNVPSTIKNVVVKNLNETNLQVQSVSLSGTNSDDYILNEDCNGVDLSPGETCSISLSIIAQDYGTRQAELVVTSNDPKIPVVKLKLKAKALPAKIFVKPRSLNFGKVNTTGSFQQQITIQNTGFTPLAILSMEITGDNSGDFTISPTDCPVLLEGQTCAVTVTFAPGGQGKRTGELVISSDAPKKGSVAIKLKGVGV